jgi:integrase
MANGIYKRTRKDGTVSYTVRIRKYGLEINKSFPTLTMAKEWKRQAEVDAAQRKFIRRSEAEKHTLGELLDRYERDVLRLKRSNTIKGQLGHLQYWRERLGRYSLAELEDSTLIPDEQSRLLGGGRMGVRSPATVNRFFALLRHVFSKGQEWRWCETNPVPKALKEPRGRDRFLDDDERERLLVACRASKNKLLYPAVLLALTTGARRSELMNLQWSQVDFVKQKITLHETKSGKKRALFLAPITVDVLKALMSESADKNDLVFPSIANRRKPVDLTASFGAALRSAGIDSFRWHDMRHTFASYLARHGASLAEIAEAMGHETLAMVKRYSHLTDSHTHSVVSGMVEEIYI